VDSKVLIPHRQLNKGRVDAAVYPKVMHRKYKSLISYGNKFRDFAKNPAAMSGIAIGQVREERASQSSDREVPAYGQAYIVRQFKRSEEIDLMRQVYGRKFIQVSAYGSALERREVLIQKIKAYDASPKSDTECEKQALDLIAIDHNQKDDEHGQRLSDVFHLGDVFVNGIDRANARATIARFIRAFFGHNGESPTKDEYGLYTATAASLRSIDLSRQIGAAIFSSNGEIVSMGCNEVPKRGGGTYWCDDPDPPHRDFERGFDANQERRAEIIFDLLQRMNVEGLLSDKIKRLKNMQERVNKIMSRRRVRDSQVMDIIEFGRIIHAEMSAISDAARLG
jgi:deoxycytidylate deaminase